MFSGLRPVTFLETLRHSCARAGYGRRLAASRLLAAVTAWMSPVRCRLNLPSARPGYSRRRQRRPDDAEGRYPARAGECGSSLARWAPNAWLRPTVVVGLPSPSGVGVIAVTSIYFALRAVLELFDNVEMDLGFVFTVEVEIVFGQTNLRGNFHDGRNGGLRDIDIAGNGFEIGVNCGILRDSFFAVQMVMIVVDACRLRSWQPVHTKVVPYCIIFRRRNHDTGHDLEQFVPEFASKSSGRKKDAVDGPTGVFAGTTGCQSSNFSSLLARFRELVTLTCRSTSLPSLK